MLQQHWSCNQMFDMDDWSQHRTSNDFWRRRKKKRIFRRFYDRSSYPRMKRPERAGIIRRLFASKTEAKANLAAVNVKKDSVVLRRICCVICKWWFPSVVDVVCSIPSERQTIMFFDILFVYERFLHLARTPMTHQTAVTIEIPSKPVHRSASKSIEFPMKTNVLFSFFELTSDTISSRWKNRNRDRWNILIC